MKVDMVMPQMGESITEATVSKWLKGVGEAVEKDEIILEISTDKVDSEIPAPEAGVLAEILANEGDTVPVKERIAVIDTEGSATTSSSNGSNAKAAPSPEPPSPTDGSDPAPPASPSNESGSTSGKFYSPLVRSLADKHGIAHSELDRIAGSGAQGRVTKQDLMTYIDNRNTQAGTASPAPAAQPSPPTQSKPTAPKATPPAIDWDSENVNIVPMDKMRQMIAEHMVRSKHTSPHVYSVQEVDVTRIAQWRAKQKNEFKRREGFNLSFTPFFLEAAIQGLLQYPLVNSSVDGHKIIMKKNINLGCAVALGNTGLIVPVIKKAEEKNFVGVCRSLNDLATRARNKKLLPDDVAGGTFTVTNPGVFGTMIGTPIINQPQVAILCLGAIKKRPVVIDNMIAIRDICYLTLSYDHRIVDGALGGQYLAFVREYLENWDMERTL